MKSCANFLARCRCGLCHHRAQTAGMRLTSLCMTALQTHQKQSKKKDIQVTFVQPGSLGLKFTKSVRPGGGDSHWRNYHFTTRCIGRDLNGIAAWTTRIDSAVFWNSQPVLLVSRLSRFPCPQDCLSYSLPDPVG